MSSQSIYIHIHVIVVEISHGNKFTEALKICALANASDDSAVCCLGVLGMVVVLVIE